MQKLQNIINAIKAVNYKNVAERAAWTFLEVFIITALVAADALIDLLFKGDWSGLMALALTTAISGGSAGLSAVKTVIVDVVRQIKQNAGV